MAARTEEGLRGELERLAGRPLALALTRNVSRYVSFSPGREPLAVRLHEAFLDAPAEVLAALAAWLSGGQRRAPRAVRDFVSASAARLGREVTRPRPVRLAPRGQWFDLAVLLERVNGEFFGGRISAPITWSRRSRRRAVRARRLGAYCRRRHFISINPVLDRPTVPEWFVAFIIYHECLHSLQGPQERPHGRPFREAMRRHPDFERARRWQAWNLKGLTRAD